MTFLQTEVERLRTRVVEQAQRITDLEAEIGRLRAAAPDEEIEAGCRAVYGSGWDGPRDKQPGEKMKEIWRALVRKVVEAVDRTRGNVT